MTNPKNLRLTLIELLQQKDPGSERVQELLKINYACYFGQVLFKPGELEDLKMCQSLAEYYGLADYESLFSGLLENARSIEGEPEKFIQF